MIGRGALGRRGEMEAGAGTGLADSGTAHGAFAFADEAAAAAAGRQAGGQQADRLLCLPSPDQQHTLPPDLCPGTRRERTHRHLLRAGC